ncbi:MAG: hypothetical protein OFPII_21330 [Osedax symbiont Rs1]|nr:MAG: hypothetical protein OFPII_21330 [Osedax symbiont Rs1]
MDLSPTKLYHSIVYHKKLIVDVFSLICQRVKNILENQVTNFSFNP